MKTIDTIKKRIKRGEDYWKKENESKFKRYQNYLRIRHHILEPNSDQIAIPMIHTIVRTKLPAIFLRNPKFLVKMSHKLNSGADQIGYKNIKTVQSIMDYLPEEIGMEDEVKAAVMDYISYGMGVVKIGYEFEKEEEKKNILQKGISKVKETVGIKEEEPKILVDRFFVKRVSYPTKKFIYDPDSENFLKGANWCAEKVSDLLENVKNNKNFKNTKDLKENAKAEDIDDEARKPEDDDKRLEYWYYYKKNRFGVCDKLYIVVPDQDVVLFESNNPYKHGEFPYEEINNYTVNDYLYPMGDIEPLERMQEELDISENLLFAHFKRFIQKYVAKKGTMDSKAKKAFEEPENAVIELEETSELRALENPSVNQSIPLASQTIQDNMTQVSGISEYQRASMPTVKRTLGEAQMVQQGSMQRSDESVSDVEHYLKRIGRKLFQTVQQYMTGEFIIKIAGSQQPQMPQPQMQPEMNPEMENGIEEGMELQPEELAGIPPIPQESQMQQQLPQDYYETITEEDIQGEFNIDIESKSTLPINQDIIKKQALDLFNLLRKDPMINPIKLISDLLTAFEKKDVESYIQPPPPPMPQVPGQPGQELGPAPTVSRDAMSQDRNLNQV